MTSRRDALAGLSLYTASRNRALLAQRAAWWAVSAFGPHALPGRSRELVLPFDEEASVELRSVLEREVGQFDSYAAHLRRPMARSGIALLLLHGGAPIGFVKLRQAPADALTTEHAALVGLHNAPGLAFAAPEPIATGSVGTWHYLLMSALPTGIHRPAAPVPVGTILSDLASALQHTIPRPTPAASHWEPMHGDFTPWNLRDAGLDRPVLLDWEEVTWAPPHADALWYEASCRNAGLKITTKGASYTDEVRTFWIERLSRIVVPGEGTIQSYTLNLLNEGAL